MKTMRRTGREEETSPQQQKQCSLYNGGREGNEVLTFIFEVYNIKVYDTVSIEIRFRI